MPIPLLTAPPTAPATNNPSTFDQLADALVAWHATNVSEMNVVIPQINAVSALSEGAIAAAAAVAATHDTTKWIAGTNYAEGVNVYSPITYLTYRRRAPGGVSNTDPASDEAGWQVLLKTVVATAATTAGQSVVLTKDSAYLQTISPTGYGASFTLPDATTLTGLSRSDYLLSNDKDYPVAVRDKTGVLRFALPPLTSVTVTCIDKSTAAGKWAFDREGAPAMITAMKRFDDYQLANLSIKAMFTGATAEAVAILSSTLVVYGMRPLSGPDYLYLVACNPLTNEWSTPLLVEATAMQAAQDMFQLHPVDATRLLVLFKTNGTKGVVVTYTGLTGTLGAIVQSAQGLRIGNDSRLQMWVVNPSLYVYVDGSGVNCYAVVISVNGNAVTFDAAVNIFAADSFSQYPRIQQYDTNKALIVAANGAGNGFNYLKGIQINLATRAITQGGQTTTTTALSHVLECVALTATKLIGVSYYTSNYYRICGVDMTTLTPVLSPYLEQAVANTATTVSPETRPLHRVSDTSALFYHYVGPGDVRAMVITWNGNTGSAPGRAGAYQNDANQLFGTQGAIFPEPEGDMFPCQFSNTQGSFPLPNFFRQCSLTATGVRFDQNIAGSSSVVHGETHDFGKLPGLPVWLAFSNSNGSYQSQHPLVMLKKFGSEIRQIANFPIVGRLRSIVASGNQIAFTATTGRTTSTPIQTVIEMVAP